jgi:VWFA-related protein
LYLIGQGRATASMPLQKILGRIAQVSGGRAVFVDNVARLHATFNDIVEELSNQYLLTYPPSNAKQDDAWRRIDVELVGGSHKVRARRGYRAVHRIGQ